MSDMRKGEVLVQEPGTLQPDALWVERNRGAMASYDAFVEKEGLILEDVGVFDYWFRHCSHAGAGPAAVRRR